MTGSAISEPVRSATLRLPAAADALGLVRLFATSMGRHVDLAPEAIEDLKLALTEVCSAAIEGARSRDDLVTVAVTWLQPARLGVRVSASSSFWMGDPAADDRARLLAALDLELRAIDDRFGVEFTVPAA